MGHDHSHAPNKNVARLGIALGLAATYMIAEVIGGLYTGSLALLADAGHMLSDVAALSLALVAIWLAKRPAAGRRTFGNHRAEVLAALFNGAALVVIGVYIVVEAVARFRDPPAIVAGPMMAIAFGGLLVNVIALFILHGGKDESLNVRGAFLHVVADAVGSVGALVAGALIWAFGWRLADPIASALIAVLVIGSAYFLLRDTLAVLMQSAPTRLDLDGLRATLESKAGVVGVHDLHAWTLTSGKELLSAHVVLAAGASWSDTLAELGRVLHDDFHIEHVTLQPEMASDTPCGCAFAT